MLQLEFGSQRFALAGDSFTVGADASCDLVVAGEGIRPRHLILNRERTGSVSVRPVEGAEATLNGVRLSAEPTPVFHGDKLFLGEHELRVVQEERAGATRILADAERLRAVPDHTAVARPAATNGRLVSLTDGREYRIEKPLVIGRDASADVVVEGDDVSRVHCEIVPAPEGYRLTDRGANGTFVNGRRVPETILLARGDHIRVGREVFRFSSEGAGPPGPPPLPEGAAERLNVTLMGLPVGPPARLPASPPARPLAAFLVRSGDLKGERLHVRAPVVNVGRAEYNDIVLSDPSVSTVHAKLQRREELWILTDQGSTNGTWVDGERVGDEAVLTPGASIRFGEVKVLFDPAEAPATEPGRPTTATPALQDQPSGRPAVQPPEAPAVVPSRRRAVQPSSRPAAPQRSSVSRWIVIIVILAALAAAAALILGNAA
jgi:pSer/pThr/pTyr-binding forkhead associated (FHA) protein